MPAAATWCYAQHWFGCICWENGILTLPTSTKLVTMTTLAEFSCQIILQKSFTVSCIGPGATEKTKGHLQREYLMPTTHFSYFLATALWIPQDPTLPSRASLHDSVLQALNSLELFEVSDTLSFLAASIWGASRLYTEVMAVLYTGEIAPVGNHV